MKLTRRQLGALGLGTIGWLGGSSPRRTRSAQVGGAATERREYPFYQYDVFTSQAMSGNQLAVFTSPEGLSDDQMQALALEMNFSESTFVFPPDDPDHSARVRIFTRTRELPMAGHPVIGTAFALALDGVFPVDSRRGVFELGIGPTGLDLEWKRGALDFAWMEQANPSFGAEIANKGLAAEGMGLPSDAIEPELPIQEVDCGATFWIVPLKRRSHVDSVQMNAAAWQLAFEQAGVQRRGLMMFSSEAADDGAQAYCRMMGSSGFEDPATGSAAGPLGSYLIHHGVVPRDQGTQIHVRQGVKMNRPSSLFIHVESDETTRQIVRVRVGGRSVLSGKGVMYV